MVRCLSGRKERFAKPSYGLNCTEGSNPSLTADKVNKNAQRPVNLMFTGFFYGMASTEDIRFKDEDVES